MTGLIGWWPLHENSGSKAYDLSGNSNHGSLNGGVTQGVAGKGGLTSYSFDGNEGYIDISGAFDYYQDFTITLWAKTETTGTSQHLFSFDTNKPLTSIVVEAGDTAGNVEYYVKDGGDDAVYTETGVSTTNWNQYTIVGKENNQIEVYLNGKLVGTDSVGSYQLQTGSNDYIAADRSSGDYFDGQLAGARIYDRALSAEEIRTLYDWGNGDYARPLDQSSSSAISRWAFDGDVTDAWNGNDGVSNDVEFVDDSIRGQAGYFNGTSSFVDVPNVNLQKSSSFSVSAWFKLDNLSSDHTILGRWDSNSEEYVSLIYGSTNDNFQFYVGQYNTGDYIVATAPDNTLSSDSWYLATAVYDSQESRVKLYVNGVLMDSQTGSVGDFSTSNGVSIGRRRNENDLYFNGEIDDVRIYDKALSPQEIFELYRWGTRGRDLRKLTVNSRGL